MGVFVQKLLWFILTYFLLLTALNSIRTRIVMVYQNCFFIPMYDNAKYSYKNCYGLSTSLPILLAASGTYSYKNCYGLSPFGFVSVGKVTLYSYKNCYGLSRSNFNRSHGLKTVFVQELLWFI